MNILDKIKTMTIEEYAKFVNDDYLVASCQSSALKKMVEEKLTQKQRDEYFTEIYSKALQKNWNDYEEFQGFNKTNNFYAHRQKLEEFINK